MAKACSSLSAAPKKNGPLILNRIVLFSHDEATICVIDSFHSVVKINVFELC